MKPMEILKSNNKQRAHITVRSSSCATKYKCNNSYLKYQPIFKTFNLQFFIDHLIPNKQILYRTNKKQSVHGNILQDLAHTALEETLANKKSLTHFTYLKKNFHQKTKTGELILKFKEHPFVLKLFIESPQGFINPYGKGIIPAFLFTMGGAMRHMLGFTRLANLKNIKEKIKNNSYWSDLVDTPRKWFWLPKNPQWLQIKEQNMTNKNELITIPATYGIITDFIHTKNNLSFLNKNHRIKCINLHNFLDGIIDPNIINFVEEKETNKLIIIDTEHFPTIVGNKMPKKLNNYFSWITNLGYCFLPNKFRSHTLK